jgi:hypothetical protein
VNTKKSFLFPQYVRLIIFCCIVFLSFFQPELAFSQEPDFYYYSDGRKIALPLSKEMLAVRFKPQASLDEQRTTIESQSNLLSFLDRRNLDILKITLLPLLQTIKNLINSRNTYALLRILHGVKDLILMFCLWYNI